MQIFSNFYENMKKKMGLYNLIKLPENQISLLRTTNNGLKQKDES